jgi:hypothetical protein
MTCNEFERVLSELEGSYSLEQEEHLRSCSSCSNLASDLETIAHCAPLLQGAHEPSPRVWNSIELVLRQEGLIHPSPAARSANVLPRWRFGWLAPVAAALLVVSGLVLRQYQSHTTHTATAPSGTAPAATASQNAAALDEDQLLGMISASAPAYRASYVSNLRAVDAYIRDAELSARNDPNDEIAQQYLMNAYEQKAMVYEMAMDRSLP